MSFPSKIWHDKCMSTLMYTLVPTFKGTTMNQSFLPLQRLFKQLVAAGLLTATSYAAVAATINISLDDDPGKLDPTQSSMIAERMVYQSIFDKLVDLDENGKIVPMLAQRWTISDDQKTYTLYLQKGVKFQDGTPFNAKAVEFNLLRGQEKSSLRRNELKYIKQITVVDDSTVKLELTTPFAPFMSILTDRAGMMSSPDAVKKFGDDYVNNPVGTGPFIYKGRLKGATITLEKNPHYWQAGLPKADGVTYKIMSDVNVAFNNLRSGQVDITNRFPYKEITNIEAGAKYAVINKPSLGFRGFYLNTSKPPFDKKEVREAVDILIDRNAIAKVVYQGAAQGSGQRSWFQLQADAADHAVRVASRSDDSGHAASGGHHRHAGKSRTGDPDRVGQSRYL